MRRLAVVLLAACGTPAPVARTPAVAHAPDHPAVAPPRRPAMTPVTPAGRAIEAPHGGEIRTLAITPDGGAAITCDELGGVRLWPALDGTQEPRVVDLAVPKELAIARRADGFFVAALDDAGNLALAALDADGRTVARGMIDGDPAFAGVVTTDGGVLAWRTDQTIARYGTDGALDGTLGTEPGERLVTVAARGGHVVALVETVVGEQVERHVRRLAVAPKLAWGAALDTGHHATGPLAVSPDGERVAYVVQDAPDKPVRAILAEARTGKNLAEVGTIVLAELGFIDNEVVAVETPNGTAWLTSKQPAPATPTQFLGGGETVLGVADGHAVTRLNGQLVIQTPAGNQFLGYGIESPTVVAAGPEGKLLVGGTGDAFAVLGAELRADATPAPQIPAGANVFQARWLGGADWAVELSQPTDGTIQVVLASADRPPQPVRSGGRVLQPMQYEPSTRLLTLSLGDAPEIDRYDPAKRALERVVALPKHKGYEQVELVPVSPQLAHGTSIIKVTIHDRTKVEWTTDDKASTSAATVTVDSFAAADAAGDVFVWTYRDGKLVLEVRSADGRSSPFPHDGAVALWPADDGKRVLVTSVRGVALAQLDGTPLWKQDLVGVHEALWLSDGTLAIVTAGGIARIDAATGRVSTARCGWRFGLATKPHPATPRIEPICTQLDRR